MPGVVKETTANRVDTCLHDLHYSERVGLILGYCVCVCGAATRILSEPSQFQVSKAQQANTGMDGEK